MCSIYFFRFKSEVVGFFRGLNLGLKINLIVKSKFEGLMIEKNMSQINLIISMKRLD